MIKPIDIRSILTLFPLLCASLAFAQPTLELALDSLIGRSYQSNWSFETENIMFQDPAGTFNQFFDFSDVLDETAGPVRTWKTPSEASKYSYFPDATLCYTQNELNLERFFGLDADSNFVEIGTYYLDQGKDVLEFLDNPRIVALPTASFGSSFTDTINGRVFFDGDTILYQNVHEVSMISYGTVRTPEHIYTNCLIERESQLDSFGNIHRNNYTYYHENLNNPVLNVTLRSYPSEEILFIVYLASESQPVSVSVIEPVVDNAYLSPTLIILETNATKHLSLMLFDISGKIVFQTKEATVIGKNSIPLNRELLSGYYILLIVDENGYFNSKKIFMGD